VNKFPQIALATALLIATPTIAASLFVAPAVAAPEQRLDGVFGDDQWTVVVSYNRNTYRYTANKIGSQNSIDLAGATLDGTRDRRIYTWNNGRTRYQAIWQPKDPDFVRIRVLSPNGKEVFNRLLARQEGGC
jgi:hypothetical protein